MFTWDSQCIQVNSHEFTQVHLGSYQFTLVKSFFFYQVLVPEGGIPGVHGPGALKARFVLVAIRNVRELAPTHLPMEMVMIVRGLV